MAFGLLVSSALELRCSGLASCKCLWLLKLLGLNLASDLADAKFSGMQRRKIPKVLGPSLSVSAGQGRIRSFSTASKAALEGRRVKENRRTQTTSLPVEKQNSPLQPTCREQAE